MPDLAPLTDWQPFCPGCGFVERIDDDGTCSCGSDTCGLDQILERLAERGLHVVSGAEKAVLDVVATIHAATLDAWRNGTTTGLFYAHERELATAELARREGVADGR